MKKVRTPIRTIRVPISFQFQIRGSAKGGTSTFLCARPDAEYQLDATKGVRITLQSEAYEKLPAPVSSSKAVVRTGSIMATGDTNGDGAEEAAVLLLVHGAGSSTFACLVPVIDEAGAAVPLRGFLR